MTNAPSIALVLLLSLSLASCELVEGIFKAGVWVGVIAVVLLVALIWFLSRLVR